MVVEKKRKYEIEDLPWEIWVDIKWYEWLYQVSNMGRVKGLDRECISKWWKVMYLKSKIRKACSTKQWSGYKHKIMLMCLSKSWVKDSFSLKRLVGCNFLCWLKDKDIIHIDWDYKNNKLSNLKLVNSYERQSEVAKKWKNKRVIQKDLYWNIVMIHDSITEATQCFTKKRGSHIWKCASGRCETAYWYKREYAKE
jgi:hypothetical protein